MSCKEKIKEFGVGDKHHIPGCEWGYDNEGMGPDKWSEWWGVNIITINNQVQTQHQHIQISNGFYSF